MVLKRKRGDEWVEFKPKHPSVDDDEDDDQPQIAYASSSSVPNLVGTSTSASTSTITPQQQEPTQPAPTRQKRQKRALDALAPSAGWVEQAPILVTDAETNDASGAGRPRRSARATKGVPPATTAPSIISVSSSSSTPSVKGTATRKTAAKSKGKTREEPAATVPMGTTTATSAYSGVPAPFPMSMGSGIPAPFPMSMGSGVPAAVAYPTYTPPPPSNPYYVYAYASASQPVAGSSSQPAPAPAQASQPAPTKKGRGAAAKATTGSSAAAKGKGKKAAKEPVEKRPAQYRNHCPQDVMQRYERARTQRFFMVDRRRNGQELREEFSVLGSTGNVYTIVVGPKPSCDCPDARKGHTCKHILFVMTKVLQIPTSSPLWYQKGLLTSELETIFASAPAAPNAVTNRRVQEAYARATGKAPAASSSSAAATSSQGDAAGGSKRKKMEEDDDCPICYETMYKVDEKKLVYCDECGNAVHDGCFGQWKASSARSGKDLTCVYCRSKWVLPAASKAGGAKAGRGGDGWFNGSYLNLASEVGLSPQRDTSTYYHGPRRRGYGGRYNPYGGYDYDDFF